MKVTITERLREKYPDEIEELRRQVRNLKYGKKSDDAEPIKLGGKIFTIVDARKLKYK